MTLGTHRLLTIFDVMASTTVPEQLSCVAVDANPERVTHLHSANPAPWRHGTPAVDPTGSYSQLATCMNTISTRSISYIGC